MSLRRPLGFLVKLVVVGLIVYGARHVDFRGLIDTMGRSTAVDTATRRGAIGEPAPGPGLDRAADHPGCVDLNSADRADLERIVHVGGDRSREIMEQRLVRPFRSLDDLYRLTSVGPGTIEDIRRQGLACIR